MHMNTNTKTNTNIIENQHHDYVYDYHADADYGYGHDQGYDWYQRTNIIPKTDTGTNSDASNKTKNKTNITPPQKLGSCLFVADGLPHFGTCPP